MGFNFRAAFLAWVSVFSFACTDVPDAAEQATQELLGGTPTDERPEVGMFLYRGQHWCTATLIHPRVILTAAHCFGYQTNPAEYAFQPPNGQPVAVVKINSWAPRLYGADATDVLIAWLAAEVPQSVAVPAPVSGSPPSNGEWLTAYGYGCTDRDSYEGAGVKRKFSFIHQESAPQKTLCAGDSGGPTFNQAGRIIWVASGYAGSSAEGTDIHGLAFSYAQEIERIILDWSRPAEAPTPSLRPGQSLTSGQSVSSPNGRYRLTYQADGNLVLTRDGVQVLWASNTSGTAPGITLMQDDGNLVIYASFRSPVWWSGTNGAIGAYLSIQDDGNTAIYSSSGARLFAMYTPTSAQPPTPTVIGQIGQVAVIGYSSYLTGWACARTSNSSIAVHLYANGPAGQGTFVGAFVANVASEPTVAQACSASGTAYRFQIPLDNYRARYSDQPLYVHGISPFGLGNPLLTGSGQFRMPWAKGLRAGDFNGDRKADLAVFRPSNSTWYVRGQFELAYGGAGDMPQVGDFTGDGKADLVVFRPSNGTWYINHVGTPFGISGDVPIPADYDGDGRTDIAVFRPSTSTWFMLRSTAGYLAVPYGGVGDIPVPADYDGDRKADLAVFRPGNATWYVSESRSGAQQIAQFGVPSDTPVPADYNGDGKADVAVYRRSTATWFVRGGTTQQWGTLEDVPVPRDYDGDGKADIAVWRPSGGLWFVAPSGAGVQWGLPGDMPL